MVNCQYPTNQARTPLNRPSQATQTQVAEAQQPRTRPPSWLAPTPPTEASPGQELAPDQVRSLPSSRGDSPPNRLRLHSHLDRHQRPTQRWPSWTSHHLPPTRSHLPQHLLCSRDLATLQAAAPATRLAPSLSPGRSTSPASLLLPHLPHLTPTRLNWSRKCSRQRRPCRPRRHCHLPRSRQRPPPN